VYSTEFGRLGEACRDLIDALGSTFASSARNTSSVSEPAVIRSGGNFRYRNIAPATILNARRIVADAVGAHESPEQNTGGFASTGSLKMNG
jgi:hypothetical protein